MQMGKASTADSSSVESYKALKYSRLKLSGKLQSTRFIVVTILLRTVSMGGWAAMAAWDGGTGGFILSTCCEVAAGGW